LQTKLAPDSNWVHFAIDMSTYYVSNIYPDSLLIQFVSSTQNTTVFGSTLHIDNVRFGYVNPPVSVTASGSTTFCTGDSVALQAHTGTSTGYTYQWQLAGAPVTGATSAGYEAKAAGTYTVMIDSAGVTATSQNIVVTDTTCIGAGISNVATTHLTIYPNPAAGLLNIEANTSLGGYNLQVYDIVGRLVISQVLEISNNNVVNVAGLSNGTYVVRITDKQSDIILQEKFNVLR
jgi:hypothetical protein